MLKIQQNVRTSGLGMGDQAEVTASVGLGQMILASGITAAMMAAAAIVVEGVKYYWLKGDDEGVVLRSEEGLEVKFESIKHAEEAKDQLEELIKAAKEKDEKKAKDEKKDKKKAA